MSSQTQVFLVAWQYLQKTYVEFLLIPEVKLLQKYFGYSCFLGAVLTEYGVGGGGGSGGNTAQEQPEEGSTKQLFYNCGQKQKLVTVYRAALDGCSDEFNSMISYRSRKLFYME